MLCSSQFCYKVLCCPVVYTISSLTLAEAVRGNVMKLIF